MTESAAHLVDEVIPAVAVRQWVLTFPFDLRYLLAWNAPLRSAVLGAFMRALEAHYHKQARAQGGACHTASPGQKWRCRSRSRRPRRPGIPGCLRIRPRRVRDAFEAVGVAGPTKAVRAVETFFWKDWRERRSLQAE